MTQSPRRLIASVTRAPDAVAAAQRLRHRVFVAEGGAADIGPLAGHEADAHDRACDHVIVRDTGKPGAPVVATVRLAAGGAYTETEFDLSALHSSGRRCAEAGRACLDPAYRGGAAGYVLLRTMADHLQAKGAEVVIGAASFPGCDPAPHMDALRRLRHEALAPAHLRPVARGPGAVPVDGTAPRAAMAGVPSLIKTYLRAGAWVGEGAWIDRAFGTVDICIVLDMDRLRLPAAAAAMVAAT